MGVPSLQVVVTHRPCIPASGDKGKIELSVPIMQTLVLPYLEDTGSDFLEFRCVLRGCYGLHATLPSLKPIESHLRNGFVRHLTISSIDYILTGVALAALSPLPSTAVSMQFVIASLHVCMTCCLPADVKQLMRGPYHSDFEDPEYISRVANKIMALRDVGVFTIEAATIGLLCSCGVARVLNALPIALPIALADATLYDHSYIICFAIDTVASIDESVQRCFRPEHAS